MATPTTTGSPVVVPPSSPPALFRRRQISAAEASGGIPVDLVVDLRAAQAGGLEAHPDLDPFSPGSPSSLRRASRRDDDPTTRGFPSPPACPWPPPRTRRPACLPPSRPGRMASTHRLAKPPRPDSAPATPPRRRSCPRGMGSGRRASTPPRETTWLPTRTPNSARRRRATAPAATLAEVSRALERSRMSRASVRSYFRMPTRSACPGLGRYTRRSASSSASGTRLHGHGGPPVLPVPVHDPHGQGRAQRLAEAHAAEDLAGVLLDLHAPAPAVAQLAAGQIAGDVERLQRESRRHALDDDQHPLAVGLAGRREPKVGQHAAITPRPRPPRHRPFAPRPMVTRVPRGKRAGRPTRGAPAGPCAGVDGSRSVRSHVGIRRPVRGRPVPDDVRRHENDQILLLLVV